MNDLFQYAAARDTALAQVERNAGPSFMSLATAFVLTYLETHPQASGEELSDACKAQGIVPHTDRAFGPVYLSLSRRKLIEKCGTAIRTKGHLASGGNLWKLADPSMSAISRRSEAAKHEVTIPSLPHGCARYAEEVGHAKAIPATGASRDSLESYVGEARQSNAPATTHEPARKSKAQL